MPDTLTEEATGTVKRGPGRPPSSPAAIAQPETKLPDWVSPEEAESYEQMLFKPYVRKTEKVEGESKKFFYQIVSMHPYVPKAIEVTATHQHLVSFEIQKFYRDKTIKRNEFVENRKAPKEVTTALEVPWVEINPKDGTSRVLDADATFNMDSRQFIKEFQRDEK